jgi:two-component system chemotaxis response regulator CheB
MEKRNIIVIGASAGGFEALKRLVGDLSPDLDAAIFIVWHMPADIKGVLPQVLNKQKTLMAAHAVDFEPVVFNRIYVAPPDRHLVLDKGIVRVTRGPKENRFRPAVDPLFRSAAFSYGPRVIGIILSGALDDGSAGLWTVKKRGGIAIVQDPVDAEVSSMPENALQSVDVDYRVPVAEMGSLLQKITEEEIEDVKDPDMEENKRTGAEVNIAIDGTAVVGGLLQFGQLTPYACPECHGVLSRIKEGNIVRYRCHTGHAYSVDSLLTSITEKVEDSLWNAIRGVEESVILLNNLGDHFAEINQPKVAALYFKKAQEAESRIKLIRQTVLNHEQLSTDSILQEASETGNPGDGS